MAFSNIENSEKLNIINIAIINNEDFENNEVFKQAFNTLSDEENNDRLFYTQYVTEEKAKELLQNDEIIGYMVLEKDKPKIVMATNGINETIFKYVTEEIKQTSDMIKNIVEDKIKEEVIQGNYNLNYEKIYNNILKIIQNQETNIEDISSSNLSYTMIEFYTLIAMTCLYGGILGMVSINQNLANMSSKRKKNISYSNSKRKDCFK